MAEETQQFPTDEKEYYYRCRIHEIEKAQKAYDQYNDYLIKHCDAILGVTQSPTPGTETEASGTETEAPSSRSIKEQHQKLKKDYDDYSDIIIKKTNINSYEEYRRNMENLMLVANETIVFCYENYGCLKNKTLKNKYELGDYKKKKNVKFVLEQNKRIPFLLNSDDSVNNAINKVQVILVVITALCTFILSLLLILLVFYMYDLITHNFDGLQEISNSEENTALVLSTIISFGFGLFILKSKGYKITEIRSNAYSKTKNYVYKPFKQERKKIKFNDLKSFIEFIINMAKSIKE